MCTEWHLVNDGERARMIEICSTLRVTLHDGVFSLMDFPMFFFGQARYRDTPVIGHESSTFTC